MSIASVRISSDFQEAISASEDFDSPAVGFARSSDYKSGVAAQNAAVIKQNNTLLYLVAKQNQRLQNVEEKIEKLQKEVSRSKEVAPADLEESIANLSKRLDKASIKEKQVAPRKQGPVYFYQDPNKIFAEEYKKDSKK
jgi:hypothetical protein